MYIYLYDLRLASWEQAFPFTDYGYRFTLTNFLVLAVGIQQRCINSNENCILLPFRDIKRSSTYVSRLTESRITVLAFRFVSFVIARCYSMIFIFRLIWRLGKWERKGFNIGNLCFVQNTLWSRLKEEQRFFLRRTNEGMIRLLAILDVSASRVWRATLFTGQFRANTGCAKYYFFFFLHVKLQTCALAPHFRYTFLDIRFLSFPFLLFRANVVNTVWTYKTYTRSWWVVSAEFFFGYTNFSAN